MFFVVNKFFLSIRRICTDSTSRAKMSQPAHIAKSAGNPSRRRRDGLEKEWRWTFTCTVFLILQALDAMRDRRSVTRDWTASNQLPPMTSRRIQHNSAFNAPTRHYCLCCLYYYCTITTVHAYIVGCTTMAQVVVTTVSQWLKTAIPNTLKRAAFRFIMV